MADFIAAHIVFCGMIFAFFVLTTDSVIIIAIIKRRRFKATGWFHNFGFEIEADDDNRPNDPMKK